MPEIKNKVQYIEVSKLKLHEQNPRTISGPQFKVLCDSIKANPAYFEARPCLCNKDMVVFAGNMRLRAATDLGLKEVPTIIMDVTPEQEKELMIRDNISNGEWQVDVLANNYDIADLKGYGLDVMDIFGKEVTPSDLDDKVPSEASGEPVAKRGDVFQLGDHRLMCGDATSAVDVETLMAGSKATLFITDPPYNVALGTDESPAVAKDHRRRTDGLVVPNDDMTDTEFRKFLTDAFSAANEEALAPGAVFYIWHADNEGLNFRGACNDIDWKVRQCLIWNKSALIMGRRDYHWKHEPCLYGWKEGAAHYWGGDRTQTTILEFDRPTDSEIHPTMKPVEMFSYQIANSSKEGDVVLDTFLGSGTTLIACEKLGRICHGMELDPRYVDKIVKRWEEYTGKKAERLASAAVIGR